MRLPTIRPVFRTSGAILTSVVLTSACAKPSANDAGQTTTTQTATESGDPDDTSSSSDSLDSADDDETDDETDTSDDGMVFVPEDEFPTLCSLDELSVCDEFAQDCPEGEKCVPFHIDDCSFQRCETITGDKLAGEPCSVGEMGGDDCGVDSWCYPGTFNLEAPAVCIPFCQGTPDESSCPEPTEVCVYDFVEYHGPLGCRPICDPLMPEGCNAVERCTLSHDGQSDFACVLGGAVADGEVCDHHQQCDSGLCVLDESLLECAGESCCSPWCDLMAPNCAMGLECVPVEVDDPNSTVGVCALG
jgi:hypothetical protein